MISTSDHRILRKKDFSAFYTNFHKPFSEQIEKLKQALDYGIKNETLAIEAEIILLNDFIIVVKLLLSNFLVGCKPWWGYFWHKNSKKRLIRDPIHLQ